MGWHWIWWIAAAVLIGAEVVTGTFYLLAVGIAAAIGGVAAWLGAGLPLQYLIAGGLAAALLAIAEANAKAIRQVADAINEPGGMNAVNLKVAEQYIAAFGNLAKAGNTLIVPSNLADLASLVTSVTTMLKAPR